MGKLSVGQKLWYVPADGRDAHLARYVTVTDIGRKWATLERNGRVNIETMWVESRPGYPSPGQCHISKEAFEDEVQRQKAWWAIREGIGYRCAPDTVTTDAIYQAASLLGIELPARSDTGETP